jgi:hypothetical protein
MMMMWMEGGNYGIGKEGLLNEMEYYEGRTKR